MVTHHLFLIIKYEVAEIGREAVAKNGRLVLFWRRIQLCFGHGGTMMAVSRGD